MAEHRLLVDDEFQIASLGSTATILEARVVVQYDDGTLASFELRTTSNSDGTSATENFGQIGARGGRVVRAAVEAITAVRRGQCYCQLLVVNKGRTMDVLAADYVHLSNTLSLDTRRGPLEGPGYLHVETVTDNVDDPATPIIWTPAVTNRKRVIYATLWFYGVGGTVGSARALQQKWRRPFGALPSQYTAGAAEDIYATPTTLTLSANEEGLMVQGDWARGPGFGAINDTTTFTTQNTSILPVPLPFTVFEADPFTMRFDHSNGETGDFVSIYALVEDWFYE